MAVLSKMVIEQIAKKMTDKSYKNVQQLRTDYQQLATDLYESKVPEKVKEFSKSYREYVEMTGCVRLIGPGFNHETINTTKRVISNTCSSYSGNLNLTEKQATELVNVKRKWEKAKENHKQLLQETEAALLTLKTHKNIKENLPQAAPYLPPPMSNALVVNFETLKRKLDKQPTVVPVLTS